MTENKDQQWIAYALELARQAANQGEVPVGAILVQDDKIIGQGHNRPISNCDPTAHAEVLALRDAARQLQNYRLLNTTLYVTLEPCAMCVGAMIHARIQRLVFGALDPRAGAIESVFQIANEAKLNHRFSWQGGVKAAECGLVLKEFFQAKRTGLQTEKL